MSGALVPPPKTPRPYGFQPGQSGNPGGRPKGLTTLARQRTRDGRELIEFFLKVFRGTLTFNAVDVYGKPITRKPTPSERIEAAEWLADRGFGKPVQTVETPTAPLGDVVFVFQDRPPDAR